jgi:hypothetical protein
MTLQRWQQPEDRYLRDGVSELLRVHRQRLGVQIDRYGHESVVPEDVEHVGDGHGTAEHLGPARQLERLQQQVEPGAAPPPSALSMELVRQ